MTDGALDLSGDAASRRGRLASAFVLLLGGVLYPTWQPLHRLLDPGAVDPLGERLAVAGICLGFLLVAAHPRLRDRLPRLSEIAVYVGVGHFFSLVLRNHLAESYAMSTLVVLPAVTLAFTSLRALLAFSGYAVILAGLVAWLAEAHVAERGIYFLGVVCVQGMMTALTWRNLALTEAASRRVHLARDFLGAVLDAIPDPVFVIDRARRPLLLNRAMAAAGFDPVALVPGAEGEVGTDGAAERERAVTGKGGEGRVVLLKLAPHVLGDGLDGHIGIARDITERKALEHSLEIKVRELEEARQHVRQLEGLLPICMLCGRIREGKEWQKLETYVEKHSRAVFSHGLCDSCVHTHDAMMEGGVG
jgi:PAS domain-containing protein